MADTNTTDDNDKSSVREYSGKWWCQQLEEVEKELDDRWRAPADKIVNRYLDDRRDSDANDSQRKYNIFWANVQIVKSALYANPPKPAVTRAHGDATDDIARVAAMIIERILINDLQDDDSPTHRAFNNGVEDRLLPGLGQVWARYTVETEKYQIPAVQGIDPTTNETVEVSPAQEAERITHEAAPLDYVHWRDFLWSPCPHLGRSVVGGPPRVDEEEKLHQNVRPRCVRRDQGQLRHQDRTARQRAQGLYEGPR
jgi:hypothetical protein